jgi:hypothetical protein
MHYTGLRTHYNPPLKNATILNLGGLRERQQPGGSPKIKEKIKRSPRNQASIEPPALDAS